MSISRGAKLDDRSGPSRSIELRRCKVARRRIAVDFDEVASGDLRIAVLNPEEDSSRLILEERYEVFRRAIGDDSLEMDGILLLGLGRRKRPHLGHLCEDPCVVLLTGLGMAWGRKCERYQHQRAHDWASVYASQIGRASCRSHQYPVQESSGRSCSSSGRQKTQRNRAAGAAVLFIVQV